MFIKGARIIDFEKLREIIGDYQQLQYVKGAVELPLHCAEASDSDHLGQEYWLGAPQISSAPVATSTSASAVASADVDPRKEHWEQRARCYDLVLDSLESFEGKTGKESEEAERIRAHAYELAFASPDEMFHSCLYEWLIGRGLADELLEVGLIAHFLSVIRYSTYAVLLRCALHTSKHIYNVTPLRWTSINCSGNFMLKTVSRYEQHKSSMFSLNPSSSSSFLRRAPK